MSDRRNGLYYESMGIRNHVLTRNIGEYMSYKHSMLENGGLAIGMPYAVETEFVPYTLSERAADGLHLTVLTGKMPNPRYNLAWRQGGLFGYTHEVINPHFDWIHRNQNLIESYFDYDSTEDLQERLDTFPSSLPWGQTGFLNGSESPGLRAYSSFNDPQNSEYFYDYTDFIRTIFTGGLSFDKQLGDHYLTNLLYDGFSKETIDTGVAGFIDEKAGFITDDIDAVLKPIEDTKLGYIGRILLGEEKVKQINGIGERGVIFEHKPISNLDEVKLGLGTGNENDYTIGISAYNEAEIEYQKFINDASEVLNDDLDFKHISFQEDLLRKQLRRNKYKNFHVGGDYGSKGSYADYYNIRDYLYVGEEGDEISSVVNGEMRSETLGDSVEGFFRGVGVYDSNLQNNEHYDEQDSINSGERDILSRKISYNEIERLGLDNGYGFSSKSSSLLERTKKLFQEHKIKTLVGRFHTSADDNGATTVGLTQSALDPTYGISHGRNLLKLNPTYENGYDNPYCRVWTYHHQYAKMTDLIRPFTDGETFMDLDALQAAYPGRPILRNGGRESWASKTVLNRNGMVNIVPTRKIGKDDRDRVKAKQCMFSIENLAWKNVSKDKSVIDTGEIGPLGGRIMWFPPYNLQFNESVSVSWGSNDFIGRGERIYSYTNTERTGTLSFTILADHPSILDYWMNSDNRRDNQGRDKDADDQTVLRFFAGCENLEAEDQVQSEMEGITNEYYAIKENQENKPKDEMDKTSVNENDNTNPDYVAGPPEEFTKDNSISFYVFFPNNLSGIDFVSNPKVIVNYLVKGLDGFDFNPDLTGDEEHDILPPDSVVIGDWRDNILMLTNGPGYEMGRAVEYGTSGLTSGSTAEVITHYNGTKANDIGRSYIWGYGIDKVYVKQRLCGPYGAKGDKTMKLYIPNYYDKTDYGLNNKPNVYDESCAYSFMDVAEAITPKPASGGYNYSGLGDPERVDKVLEILGLVEGENNVKNGKGRKYYFSIAGGASVHGYQDKNVDLSTRRANFLKAWLEYCFEKNNLKVDYDEEAKIQVQTGIEGGEESLDINSESAKRGRYAKAVIYWNDEDIMDGTETDKPYVVTSGETGDTREVLIDKDVQMKPGSDVSDEEAAESTRYTNTVALTDMSSTRYRDEERFFDMLKESDPVLYKHITDKVKYFDPVYHSITPEGFNSRLSFLHQCTRQGPTLSSSDLSQNNGFNGAGYAGNLSFGRAPVCVLRLGDFFNTRIIINTVQIQYETSQWDLNPEGIGVQPMLANVTLGFVFQGGSSLGGPIQRLQNAVSFNYYANQEVYDDRADVAVYSDNGELDEESTLVWIPGYGNMNLGSVNTAIQAKDPVNKTVVDEIEKDKYVALHHQQVKGNETGTNTINKDGESRAASGATGN